MQPQRLGVVDEQAEHASTVRDVADQRAGLVVEAVGDELREVLALRRQDPEGAVAGPDE